MSPARLAAVRGRVRDARNVLMESERAGGNESEPRELRHAVELLADAVEELARPE